MLYCLIPWDFPWAQAIFDCISRLSLQYRFSIKQLPKRAGQFHQNKIGRENVPENASNMTAA